MRLTIHLLVLALTAYLACFACAYESSVVVLSNSVDGPLAFKLYSFLEGRGVAVARADAISFNPNQTQGVIIILGGQNAPEGVGSYAGAVLSNADREYLTSSDSASGVFSGVDVWAENQTVIVFAGYDELQTKTAWERNLDRIPGIPSGRKIAVDIFDVSACSSVKFNEILFNITTSGTNQAAWGVNEPDKYITFYCDGSEVRNLAIFERKVGEGRYGRNDLMHKTLTGEYRLKVACNREYEGWVPDVMDCSTIGIRVTLPKEGDSGFGFASPKDFNQSAASPAKYSPNVSISYPREGDTVTVWDNGVGFLVNVTNKGASKAENLKLNAFTASGRILETNYPMFNVEAGRTQGVLVRVNSRNVVENDSIALWLEGGKKVNVKVDRRMNESVPLYCSFCAKKH